MAIPSARVFASAAVLAFVLNIIASQSVYAAGGVNVALAANGGVATASSTYGGNYSVAAVNDGDRQGLNWGAGGGWNDATGNAYPDWVQIDFSTSQTINEIDLFTIQDNYNNPITPTLSMQFSQYGVTDFEVQYWTGSSWADVPGGNVTGNRSVWRQFTFGNITTSNITTSNIRVLVNNSLRGYSRIVEIEAYTPSTQAGMNVALAANGGVATASSTYSSNFPVAAVNNGDRKGAGWGAGGGWNDATSGAYPDWVQIDFRTSQTINEIDLFTIQDNYNNPIAPTLSMQFSQYGVIDFEVQYWTGSSWADVPGGNLTGNRNVWRQFTFANITTSKIRVLVSNSLGGYSRLVEIEAYTASPPSWGNVALAGNGGVATASSTYSANYPVSAVNDGDRRGVTWGAGGGWNDATANAYPDWVQIDFSTSQTINEIDLFTIQDNYNNPITPTLSMQFSQYGVTDFEVQYWTGSSWADVPGGNVTGNRSVWRQFTFGNITTSNITTSNIRVLVNNSLGGYSRIVEIEAYQAGGSAYWIAPRTDGLSGTGTQADPFDGSTRSKFDSIMASIAPGSEIHLSAGTFSTYGSMSWRPKSGWKIYGAGMSSTTLLQSSIQAGQLQVIGGLASDVEISDLTVDCNYMNLANVISTTNKAIGAISVASGHLNNIRVLHAGGLVETFALGFCQYGVGSIPPDFVLIENCRVEQSGPNVTSIFAANSQTTNYSDTVPGAGQATIRNCYVEGTGPLAPSCIAFQIGGYKSGVIDSCSTVGCTWSIYRDTLAQTGLTITNCNINGVVNAIGLVGAPTDNVMITGNTLASGEIVVRTDGATHVTIQNNLFLPGTNYNNYWQPIKTTTSSYVANNQLSPVMLNGSGAIALGKISGNKYTDGRNIPFLMDN